MSEHIAIWKGDWNSTDNIPEHIWGDPNRDFFTRTTHPRAPGRNLKFQKLPKFLSWITFQKKGLKFEKGSLFDTITVEIISII